MNLFAPTLGLYIAFLALFPAMIGSNTRSQRHAVAANSHPCQKRYPSGTDQGSSKKCTPFFGCPKTHVVIPSTPVANPNFLSLEEQNVVYLATGLSRGFYEAWVPPKIV